jgi:hypothetical protein
MEDTNEATSSGTGDHGSTVELNQTAATIADTCEATFLLPDAGDHGSTVELNQTAATIADTSEATFLLPDAGDHGSTVELNRTAATIAAQSLLPPDTEEDPINIHDSDTDTDSDGTDLNEQDMDFSSENSDDDDNVEGHSNNGQNDDYASPPLYVLPPSSSVQPSSITHTQHMLSMCAYALKHGSSGVGFKDMAKMIKFHVPDSSLCELNIDKIKEHCGYSDESICFHEYCQRCGALFPSNGDIEVCQTPECFCRRYVDGRNKVKKHYFVSTSMETQIQGILERDGNLHKITKAKENTSSVLTDVCNGEKYKAMKTEGGFLQPSTNNNITLTCFTDGIPLYKSSKVSLWPVYLVINEIPPRERFLRKNMLLWGVWQGVSKPHMNTFLQPFVESLSRLEQDGFTFTVDGVVLHGHARMVIATMDLPARASSLNMKHHNGICGCLYCENPGVMVDSGTRGGHCRSYQPSNAPLRSDKTIQENASIATETNKVSVGIFGPTVLSHVPNFSLVSGVVIDYMHGILLGVTKKLLTLWFDGKNYKEPFFLGHQMSHIDKLLKVIAPPHTIRRLPRKLSGNYQHWKASELRSWLLYYSLPCLKSYLPPVHLQHFACLVEATYLLLGSSITANDLQEADKLLFAFNDNFGDLYGKAAVGLNVHNLLHIVQCVRDWGPLWAWSCFGFESFNGEILGLVHGTGNVSQQIIWSLQAQKHLQLATKTLPSGPMKTFFKEMLDGSARHVKSQPACMCSIVKPVPVTRVFSAEEKEFLLETTGSGEEGDYLKCNKIVFRENIIYSQDCTRVLKRNSYTVLLRQLEDGSDVGQIKHFLVHKATLKVFAVCITFKAVESLLDSQATHIQVVQETSNNRLVQVDLYLQDLLVDLGAKSGKHCVAKLPNFVERD